MPHHYKYIMQGNYKPIVPDAFKFFLPLRHKQILEYTLESKASLTRTWVP
jgi:hypothetical protein